MKTKNGFTLIELLAVILILGIIALIAVPTISKLLEESRRGAFSSTLSNVEDVIENQCNLERMKDTVITSHYVVKNGRSTPKIDAKGDIPDGDIYVSNNCGVTFTMYSKHFVAYKSTEDAEVIIDKNNGIESIEGLAGIVKSSHSIKSKPQTKPGEEYSKENEADLVKDEDDDGATYYFRGNVQDNYVQFGTYTRDMYSTSSVHPEFTEIAYFYDDYAKCSASSKCVKLRSAGDPILWRIVRINGDGTIRLSLQDSMTDLAINTQFNNEKYVGYTYDRDTNETNSTVKNYFDNWYNDTFASKPELDKLVATGKFCSDTSVYSDDGSNIYFGAYKRLMYNNSPANSKPTFNCPPTTKNYGGLYNLKIGMLTIDEYAFAGLRWLITNYDYNASMYLFNGSQNWTMSPAAFLSDGMARIGRASVVLTYNRTHSEYTIRPAINLKKDVKVESGMGTLSNPYKIK